jgi:hypothetical protein
MEMQPSQGRESFGNHSGSKTFLTTAPEASFILYSTIKSDSPQTLTKAAHHSIALKLQKQ